MTNERIKNMGGKDIDEKTGNFIVKQETVSSSDETVQVEPKLPGEPIPDRVLWKTNVLQNAGSKTTKEAGIRTPEGSYYPFEHGESLLMIRTSDGQRKPFIKLENGQEVTFQSWRLARRKEIAEILENVNQDYQIAYLLALEDFPHLDQMQIESATAEKYPALEYTGGFWTRPKSADQSPGIVVNMKQDMKYEQLLIERELSAQKTAEVIGIDFEVMKQHPKILKLFIFLHEIGHVNDYITNYPKKNDGVDPSVRNLDQRNKEMASLPIPGINPVRAKQMYDAGELQKYYLKYQQYYKQNDIKSPEELLRAHEIAYHELPSESYADQFAATILKKHWETLFNK